MSSGIIRCDFLVYSETRSSRFTSGSKKRLSMDDGMNFSTGISTGLSIHKWWRCGWWWVGLQVDLEIPGMSNVHIICSWKI